MKVEELMSKDLITIDANSPVRNAIKLMKKRKVSRLLVTKKGKIVGIVTERDLARRLGKETERKISDAHIYVSSCYSKDLICIGKDEDIKKAAKLMLQKGISSLVVKDDGNIVGIITKTDLIKALKECKEPIEKFMTKKVTTLQEDSRILEARKLMLYKNIKRIPIMRGENLIGIITEGDIAKALGLFRKVAEGKQWDEKMRRILVKDVMRVNPITLSPKDTISKAVKVMLENDISGIPIIDGGKLVGIITKTDLVKAITEVL